MKTDPLQVIHNKLDVLTKACDVEKKAVHDLAERVIARQKRQGRLNEERRELEKLILAASRDSAKFRVFCLELKRITPTMVTVLRLAGLCDGRSIFSGFDPVLRSARILAGRGFLTLAKTTPPGCWRARLTCFGQIAFHALGLGAEDEQLSLHHDEIVGVDLGSMHEIGICRASDLKH